MGGGCVGRVLAWAWAIHSIDHVIDCVDDCGQRKDRQLIGFLIGDEEVHEVVLQRGEYLVREHGHKIHGNLMYPVRFNVVLCKKDSRCCRQ